MKEIIKKIIKWFSESHRWQHLVLATVIGIWADSWYCTLLTGAGVAGALEFKDTQYGNKWDWVDFLLTMTGAAIGHCIRTIIIK